MSQPNSAIPTPHDPYAAFRSRNYRWFVSGFALGTLGFQTQNVAVGWEIYQWTGSSLSLGWIGLALGIPVIALALPAGHLADRFDRKTVTIISLFFTAFFATLMGGLSVAHQHGHVSTSASEWFMYALLFFGACSASFGRPARAALLPQIIRQDIFPNAVTWNSSIFEVSSMVGPALGGFIISRYSPAAAYFCNAGFTLLYLIFLSRLHCEPVIRSNHSAGFRDLLAGVSFVWHTRLLLGALTLDLFAVLLGGATFLLPVYARDILHVGPVGFGWLRAAPSFGAVLMAFLLAHRPPLQKAGRTMLLAVVGFGLATIVFGMSKSFPLSFAMLFLTGVFDNVSVVVRHTLVQLLTPDVMRGRVAAVNQVFIGSSNELGGLESGVTAQMFGPITSVVGGGIGTLLVVFLCWFGFPELRKLTKLSEVKPDSISV